MTNQVLLAILSGGGATGAMSLFVYVFKFGKFLARFESALKLLEIALNTVREEVIDHEARLRVQEQKR